MTNWVALIFTTLGAGAVGALITTYGTQTRARLQARATAREAIRQAENLGKTPPTVAYQAITAALDNLEISAMIAGLPRPLTELYRETRMRHWVLASGSLHPDIALIDGDVGSTDGEGTELITCLRVAHQAAQLLTAATWHPWRSTPRRWYRTRRLHAVLDAGMPVRAQLEHDARANLRRWERQTIRDAKRQRQMQHSKSAQ